MRSRFGLVPTTSTVVAWIVVIALIYGVGPWTNLRPSIHMRPSAGTAGTFSMKGNAKGLFPGATKRLPVKVTNPNKFAIKVTRITVRVKPDRSRLSCSPKTYMRATKLTRSIRVPRRSSSTAKLRITMLSAAPNACRGAVFPLRFTGEAVKA
jgi:hypothetical protein